MKSEQGRRAESIEFINMLKKTEEPPYMPDNQAYTVQEPRGVLSVGKGDLIKAVNRHPQRKNSR